MKLELIEYEPIPRNCPRCGMHGDIGIRVRYTKEKKIGYLRCLCGCGYWWGMKPKDDK